MGQIMYVVGSFFIASIIFTSAADQSNGKSIPKSRLILEYNWPEPSKSLHRLPHPRSCHHFFLTKHDGSHAIKRCHRDKVFDYRSLRCQNKSTAKCWMNIVKKGNIKKIKRSFSCPFPWGLYPDKEDCSLFYDCMGGKVYPRKCPDSTLFDVVERTCVHSKKALCAQDSNIITDDRTLSFKTATNNIENSLPNIRSITTTIPFKSSGALDTDSKEKRPEEVHSSEEVDKRDRAKSKSKFITSKLSLISKSTVNPKPYSVIAISSKEDNSEEDNSSEEKDHTKPKNRFTDLKL